MKLSKSLIFLVSKARCSIDLCKEMGWKLPSQRLGSIGALGSYGSEILITVSSTCTGLMLGYLCKPYCRFVGAALLLVLATLLTQLVFSWIVSYNSSGETSFILMSSIMVLLHSIFS